MTPGRTVDELADLMRQRKQEFRLLEQAEYVTATELIRGLVTDPSKTPEERLAEIRRVLDALDVVSREQP